MNIMRLESKIVGKNLVLITTFIFALFHLISYTGGTLVNWGFLGYEVYLPFFTVIMISENLYTRTDPIADILESEAKSIFIIILRRFFYIYSTITAIGILSIIIFTIYTPESRLFSLLAIYISNTLFLSSITVLFSLFSNKEKFSLIITGSIWILSLLLKNLVRYKIFALFYMFICFSGLPGPIWIYNKFIYFSLSIVLWLVIYVLCKYKSKFK